ncbi:DUF1254 domain-containing protein [Paraburkholderia sp. J76]|uniref:DUF1254 domain-containing protein n=1 Tax=Paraburkholderia sp. J76 TaxID=2805439 RepID=UPI002ABD69C9|nr:DUF1254 domain-containing protein [Paraburkholderia sp. J76]
MTPDTSLPLVTADNFVSAESDFYFAAAVRQGGFGRFHHRRDLMPVDQQSIVRANRDTLYSAAVFDLDAGPLTIALPEAGRDFRSLQVIDMNHHVRAVVYDAGEHTFTREQIGTRYVLLGVRTLIDPADPAQIARAHALQDSIAVMQPAQGEFEVAQWDPVSQANVRGALRALGATLPDSRGMFGAPDEVEPVRHLIGCATAWGGNPERDALYLTVAPRANDGQTVHVLQVGEVPLDGFWSISVYNREGYFEPNPHGAYTLNNLTAQRDDNGAIRIQFGGDPAAASNWLPITPGWNYMVRLYRPHASILNGEWRFPEAQPQQ